MGQSIGLDALHRSVSTTGHPMCQGGVVRCLAPTPALDRFVEYLVVANIPGHVAEQVAFLRLPETSAHIVFAIEEGSALPGGRPIDGRLQACLFLAAPHLYIETIPATVRQIVAISLRPLGLPLVVANGEAAGAELTMSPVFALETFWGNMALDLLDRLVSAHSVPRRLVILQEVLLGRLRLLQEPNRIAARAVEVIDRTHGEVTVHTLARFCECTTRTLQSALVDATGFTPKSFGRIARIRRTVDLMAGGSALKDAAAEASFCDQAHMCREFRSMLSESPKVVARQLQLSRHLPIAFYADVTMARSGLLLTRRSVRRCFT